MPSSIPYDPSLNLGGIVSQNALDDLLIRAKFQQGADAKQNYLNEMIALKRSLDITVAELTDLGVNPFENANGSEDFSGQIKDLKVKIANAAIDYYKSRSDSVEKIQAHINEKSNDNDINNNNKIHASIESPIDYNKSILVSKELSNDSLIMDVQYFSIDENEESSSAHAQKIASFVSGHVDFLGRTFSSQVSNAVQKQVVNQTSRHDISGTLVLSVACTHKSAKIFAPFVLDPDKAVQAWNQINSDDLINLNSREELEKIEKQAYTAEDNKNAINILSGASFGSTFIGMVHILNSQKTSTNQSMSSLAASFQSQFEIGGWFMKNEGGFGVDAAFSDSIKSLLSTQNIQAHCTISAMGIIPSIKSNEISIGVKAFADFDPQKEMEKLATLHNDTSEKSSVSESAAAARLGKEMISLKNSTIQATLSSLSEIDDGKNKILDINSMMSALDDYIDKCIQGGENVGVPINFFVKPITKSVIVRTWLNKYHPNKYIDFEEEGTDKGKKDDKDQDKDN